MDTARFVRWFNVDWHPGLKALAEAAGAPRSGAEADLLRTVQRPLTVPSWAREYPAHLHIDLMPVAQGQGWGRRMMRAWMAWAADRGATGVHLGVARANQRAVEFYRRLGLRALKAASGRAAGAAGREVKRIGQPTTAPRQAHPAVRGRVDSQAGPRLSFPVR